MPKISFSWALVMPMLVSCTFLLIEVTHNPITVSSDKSVKLIFRISALQNVVSGLKELSVLLARKTAPEPS